MNFSLIEPREDAKLCDHTSNISTLADLCGRSLHLEDPLDSRVLTVPQAGNRVEPQHIHKSIIVDYFVGYVNANHSPDNQMTRLSPGGADRTGDARRSP